MAKTGGNVFAKSGKFFKDVKAEFKKVIWPTPKQAVKNTIIVIVCVVVVGLLIGILDMAFSWGFKMLLNGGGKEAALALLTM